MTSEHSKQGNLETQKIHQKPLKTQWFLVETYAIKIEKSPEPGLYHQIFHKKHTSAVSYPEFF